MAEVKWIKITTTMFNDEKIRIIESMPEADAILVIWIKLLALTGKCNLGGYVYLAESIPYTDEMLATIFNRPLNIVRLALKTFEQFGMIEIDDLGIYLVNWEKHQNESKLEEIREYNRLAKQKERERRKLLLCQGQVNDCQDTDISISNSKSNSKSKNKTNYSENVKMTEEEYQKLIDKFGEVKTKDWIETLTLYKKSTGKKYKDDYATILAWDRKDTKGGKTSESSTTGSGTYKGIDTSKFLAKPVIDVDDSGLM